MSRYGIVLTRCHLRCYPIATSVLFAWRIVVLPPRRRGVTPSTSSGEPNETLQAAGFSSSFHGGYPRSTYRRQRVRQFPILSSTLSNGKRTESDRVDQLHFK